MLPLLKCKALILSKVPCTGQYETGIKAASSDAAMFTPWAGFLVKRSILVFRKM